MDFRPKQDHGKLKGLLDDDHSQHPLLAGRSGGQTLKGGTDSGDNLVLQSTNHAIKGLVQFGTASAYDEVNDRLGVGTLVPVTPLDILGKVKFDPAVADTASAVAFEFDTINELTQNGMILFDVKNQGTSYFKLRKANTQTQLIATNIHTAEIANTKITTNQMWAEAFHFRDSTAEWAEWGAAYGVVIHGRDFNMTSSVQYDIKIRGGNPTSAEEDGGDVFLVGGNALGASKNGGNVYLDGGPLAGTGTDGDIIAGNTRGNLISQNALKGNESGGDNDSYIKGNSDDNLFYCDAGNDRVGIGLSGPNAKLHIDQSNSTGAVPVITVDQADVSEEFIKFIGESTTDASQSLIDAADMTTPGSIVGWLKIYVEDVQATNPIVDGAYYVPFYSAPTA